MYSTSSYLQVKNSDGKNDQQMSVLWTVEERSVVEADEIHALRMALTMKMVKMA